MIFYYKLKSIFSYFSQIHVRNLKKLAICFKLQSIFILAICRQKRKICTSFCALEGLFLTNWNHYFSNISINTNVFSSFKMILKIGNTGPLYPSKFFIDTLSGLLLLLLFLFVCLFFFIIANFGTTCWLSIISYSMCALGIIFDF